MTERPVPLAQRRMIPPYAALRAFEAVGSCGGIRRAAHMLSIDHAAVSRHLQALEEWTGVRLVDRSAGSGGRLTESGHAYHKRVSQTFADLAAATSDLMHRTDDGRLTVWCAPGLASEWLSGRIGEFVQQHPGLDLELQPTEQGPDFGTHEADIHIVYAAAGAEMASDAKLRVMPLAQPETFPVASPDFVARHGPFERPAVLIAATLLHEANVTQWRRWFASYDIETMTDLGGTRFYQGHLTLAAARRGQGAALANWLLVGRDITEGRLVRLGPWPPASLGGYFLITRRDSWGKTRISQFRRWLRQAIATELSGGDPGTTLSVR